MAGDWIKMRVDLQTHPKVVRIMSACKADKYRVIGGLHAVWSVFDAHTEAGELDGYSLELMDEIIGWPGFSAAMAAVGWLVVNGETLVAPEFDTHNGKSAKRRCMETERKRNSRKVSASDADEMRSREEKRREEVNQDSVVESSTPVITSVAPDSPGPSLSSGITRRGLVCGLLRKAGMADAASHHLTDEAWDQIFAKRSNEEIVDFALAKLAANPGKRIGLKYIAPGLLQDPEHIAPTARGSPGRKTLTEIRIETARNLTGAPRNERTERDITAESKLLA